MKLTTEILHSYGTKYLVTFLQFSTGILIANQYGPEGRGLTASYMFVPQAVIMYSSFGFFESLMHFESKNLRLKKSQIFKSITVLIVFSLVVFMFYFLCFYNGEKKWLVQGAILLLCMFCDELLSFSLRGQLKFRTFNIVQLMKAILTFCSVIAIVSLGWKVHSVIYVYILVLIFSLVFVFRKISFKRNDKQQTVSFKDFRFYSMNLYSFKVLNSTENIFDKIIILTLLSTSEFGKYAAVTAVSGILYAIFIGPLASILLPIFNRHTPVNRSEKANQINRIVLTPLILSSLLIGSCSQLILEFLYGEEFASSGLVLSILIIGVVVKTPMTIFTTFFKSIGRPNLLVRISAITMPMNIVLGFILIPKFGILGAAWASAISYMIYSVLILRIYLKETGSDLRDLMLPRGVDFQRVKDVVSGVIGRME